MEQQLYKKWISEVFDRTAKTYGEKHNAYFDYFGKKLVEIAELTPATYVLDVATGRGAIAKEAAEKVGPKGKVVGIDISPHMIKETASALQNYPNIELFCMDAEQLNFQDHSFDTVFCGFCIFFFPNITQAIGEFFRVLKPGGKLIISTWGEDDELLAQAFFEAYKPFGVDTKLVYHNFEDPHRIKHILPSANFSNIEIIDDEIIHVYPTVKDWLDAFWGHAVRGLLEKLTPEQYIQFETALIDKLNAHLQPDGLHTHLRAHYVIAHKQNPIAIAKEQSSEN